ncbi:MAG: NDMA-dependent alcohol dehydrogenase [Mycobacterium sp.]|nr:NDMA-dependent alcohol dehydrogenase [Mycobacterium sp.]MDD4866391.1 NDMA-dependent alcohol dehydrogenase [Mycobacterium sp.]
MKTKAAVLTAPHKPFEIVELDVDDPGPGEVTVKYTSSGLCRTDLHLADGELECRFPIVGGHEGCGVVERVGANVTKVKEGDHIIASWIPSCGVCRYCSTGHQNLCDWGAYILDGVLPDGTTRFHSKGTDFGQFMLIGTFSQYATISQHSLVKVDEWIPLEPIALIGCGLPTGWGSSVNVGEVRPGHTSVIFGVGGVGMSAVQGAAMAGAKNVIVIEPVQFKRDMAAKFGATHTFDNFEEAAAKVKELTWGQMADQAMITVDTPKEEIISNAFSVVGKGGIVVLTSLGQPHERNIHVPGLELTLYEKKIKGGLFGSSNPQWDILRMSRMYDAGTLKVDEMVTTRYTLEQINDGYQDLRDGKNIRGLIVHDK